MEQRPLLPRWVELLLMPVGAVAIAWAGGEILASHDHILVDQVEKSYILQELKEIRADLKEIKSHFPSRFPYGRLDELEDYSDLSRRWLEEHDG